MQCSAVEWSGSGVEWSHRVEWSGAIEWSGVEP